jgi:hypothetical protein
MKRFDSLLMPAQAFAFLASAVLAQQPPPVPPAPPAPAVVPTPVPPAPNPTPTPAPATVAVPVESVVATVDSSAAAIAGAQARVKDLEAQLGAARQLLAGLQGAAGQPSPHIVAILKSTGGAFQVARQVYRIEGGRVRHDAAPPDLSGHTAVFATNSQGVSVVSILPPTAPVTDSTGAVVTPPAVTPPAPEAPK